ncbi:MAG: hypothetical protein KF705_12495 [Phycisphaeraceae bacterium]|nr:hypothetical protein [Phycisphaeraceae bacterium]
MKVSLRLVPRAQVSPGADLRPSSPLPATWIVQLPEGFVFLRNGTDDESPQFEFSDGWVGLNLSTAAANVGKLPGWNGAGGAPVLRLQCDSFAERARRFADSPAVNQAIDAWADLLSGTPNNLTQSLAIAQPRLFANTNTPPELRFFNDSKGSMLEQTPGYDLIQSECAFGVVFRATPGTTTATQQLIGRWNALGTVDNASTKQWRLVYERTAGSPPTHKIKAQFASPSSPFTITTLEATIDEPSAKTIAVYRVNTSGTPTGELWVNGVLVASTTTLFTAANTGASPKLTVGGRWPAFPDIENPVVNPLVGSIDQCFVYSSAISDATLTAVHHELSRRAGIKLGPVLQPDLTQPYGDSNPEVDRRLDRWPIAMINLFGGGNYDGNPLSQIEAWRNGGDRQQIVAWFRERILRILNACPDYDIMINRPQGNYANDIIAAGIFGNMDVSPNEPIIQPYQWEALSGWTDGSGTHPGVFGEFGLSDHNHRDNKAAPDSEGFARRCWFYTGNPTIDDNGAVTQNARVGARNLAPCSASFYIGNFFDPWAAKDDRFRCFFVDSASKWDRKWVEIVQDPMAHEHFTLVGEAISPDPDARKGAPWFSLFGFGQAPWWMGSSAGTLYNWMWNAGEWSGTPIYVGINKSPASGVNFDPNRPRSATNEQESLRFEDAYRVCSAGAAPVAWDGDYQKYGAAWLYGGRRIPVGRFTMLSPRISRAWR